ncbi:hypothetical protein ARMSODRAFT_1024855 [Armillaria solidipes]|uniref:Uncharacterized protein n=1 Tax=Armillaria solidipes TaxID=1076256 RepID=A0A2H3AUS2_9AGAR|nr:hypothetical protein ARMSODRAFT_1024855 [Armillaria solidipes]
MLLATSIAVHPFEWRTAVQVHPTTTSWNSGRDARSRSRCAKAVGGIAQLRVDQGYGETEPRQLGSRLRPSPGVPQEARISRGPVAGRAGVLDKPWIHQRTSRMCIHRTWIIADPVNHVCVRTFVINGRADTAEDFVVEPIHPIHVMVQITQSLDS